MNRVVAYPPPNRYNVIIRQRHINLLGRSIDLNRLLAQRINKAILNSLNTAIRRFECNNLTGIIVSVWYWCSMLKMIGVAITNLKKIDFDFDLLLCVPEELRKRDFQTFISATGGEQDIGLFHCLFGSSLSIFRCLFSQHLSGRQINCSLLDELDSCNWRWQIWSWLDSWEFIVKTNQSNYLFLTHFFVSELISARHLFSCGCL